MSRVRPGAQAASRPESGIARSQAMPQAHRASIAGVTVRPAAEDWEFAGGRIDLARVRPLLFDMQGIHYWSLGGRVAPCWNVGKAMKKGQAPAKGAPALDCPGSIRGE